MTNNDLLQNPTQKTTDRTTQAPHKRDEFMCSGRINIRLSPHNTYFKHVSAYDESDRLL